MTRKLISWERVPVIGGVICGLILSLNSTDSPRRWIYAVLGFNCLLAYLIMTLFPVKEPLPSPQEPKKSTCETGSGGREL